MVFGSTNRYFGLTVLPAAADVAAGQHSLAPVVERIMHEQSDPGLGSGQEIIFTYLISPVRTVGAGETLALDVGVFAGPLDPRVLESDAPYPPLRMKDLVLYQMSSFCAICRTWSW